MKGLLVAAGLLLAGAASAQDSGAMCRSFCDADAKQCREGDHPVAWGVADTLLHLHGSPSVSPDKHEQAADDNHKEHLAQEHQCGDARQACRRKCTAPVAASAASATP
jgi:hypothetical protein